MDNSGMLADQLAAETGCNLATARRSVMIRNFYSAGRDRNYIAQALKLKPETIKRYEKLFGIAAA